MIIVTLHLNVAPEERLNVLNILHSMTGPTNVKTGCLFCGLLSSTQNDDELILLEKWESEEELERHIRSEDFQKVLAAMDKADISPEIYFNTIANIQGIELIEKVLS